MNDNEFKQLKNNWETSDIKEKLIILEKIGNETILKIKTLQKENEKLKEINKEQANRLVSKDNLSYEDYKLRVDKAIEYINNWLEGINNEDIIIAMNILENILKGDSNGNR